MHSELDFIHNIKDKYGLKHVGDDCAVLPKDVETDLLITADMLVEDIDFQLDWTTPELLGQKALAVSLSDTAAMGGNPKWAMISVGVPGYIWDSDFLDRFYEGLYKIAAYYSVELIGGDISRTPEKIVVDSIVGGETPKGKAIVRSGAAPGDSIYVTGTLGGAAGGLMLLEAGIRYKNADKQRKELIEKQLRPIPRIEAGRYLLEKNLASAMIDISDGLSSDLHHICTASGVGARLNRNDIPLDPNLKMISPAVDEQFEIAVRGGEDFELLFTSKRKKISNPRLPDLHRIGEITANAGMVEVIGDDFEGYLAPKGYSHF